MTKEDREQANVYTQNKNEIMSARNQKQVTRYISIWNSLKQHEFYKCDCILENANHKIINMQWIKLKK